MTGSDAAMLVVADCRRICTVPAPTFAQDACAEIVAGLLRDAGWQPKFDQALEILADTPAGGS